MLLSGVGLITAIHISGVSMFSLCKLHNSVARIISNTTRCSCSYEIALGSCLNQPHLFTHFFPTGFPKYFAPYLSCCNSSYSTSSSQYLGNFLVVPKFYSSAHKSVKEFGYSFTF